MLGGDDDLAAVLAVLDRLSIELSSNRQALNETCNAADELGGGITVPREILAEVGESSEREIAHELADCQFLKQSLETAVQKVAQSKELLRKLLDSQRLHELEFRRQAARELVSWQERVGTANEEFHQIRSQSLELDAKLVKLYQHLQGLNSDKGLCA